MNWNKYKEHIINALNNLTFDKEILDLINNSKNNNQKIFVIGNGGSGATAAHYACDLSLGASKTDYLNNLKRYKLISLTSNLPLILALANDYGYDEIFKQQLINLADKNDILISISGSGNSKNIIKAVEYANDLGMITIGVSGYDGGKLKKISNYNIHVNADMETSEDIHSIFGHFLAVYLRENNS